jgi:signal peptidase I
LVLAVAIALPIQQFLLQPFVLKGSSAAPELPKGSLVLVWKLPQRFEPGDMVVYR